MADFHNTVMGKTFYQHTLPELLKQLTRIADSLEKEKKQDELGNSLSSIRKFISHYPNDQELGEQIRKIWS